MLNQKAPDIARYVDNTPIEKAFDGSKFADYSTAAGTASVDPFDAKTNQYAESSIIKLSCPAGCCLRFGASNVGAAVDGDYHVPANTIVYFAINQNEPYLRVIPLASAKVYVTEIF